MWFFSWLESQSRPSYKPSPLVAQVAWMYQFRLRNECKPNLSVISGAFIAFGKSLRLNIKESVIKRLFFLIKRWFFFVDYLFVGEDEEDGVSELVFLQHSVELISGLSDSLSIVTVHDENETLGVLEIMSPQRSNFILASNVPHSETNVFILYCFNIEPFRIKKLKLGLRFRVML